MSELKPCPLCGGPATLEGGNETHADGACWWAQCADTDCFCSIGCHYLSDDGAAAAEAWNRRTQPAQEVPTHRQPSDWVVDPVADLAADIRAARIFHQVPQVPTLTDQEVCDVCDGTLTTWSQHALARRVESALLKKMQGGA